MTGGQVTLLLDEEEDPGRVVLPEAAAADGNRAPLRRILPDAEELRAHQERLAVIDRESEGQCLWLQGQNVPD